MVPQRFDPDEPEENRRPRPLAIPAEQVVEYAPPEPEITSARILETLRRHRRKLIALSLAGTAVAVAIALAQKPLYQGKALLEIQPVNDRFLNLSEMDPTAASSPSEPYVDTQVKLLASESLLERVVDRLQLSGDRAGRFAGGWRFLHPATSRSAALAWARGHLTIRTAGQSNAVEVLFEAADPGLSAEFVNTLTQQFLDSTLERRTRLIQATAQLFSQQLGELRGNLDRSARELEDFTRSAGILATGEGDASTNVEQGRLIDLQGALARAHEDRVLQQSKYERLATGRAGDLPDMLDDEVLRNYELRLADLQRQQAELSATLTPKHYKVQEVEAQAAEMKKALDRRRQEIQDRIRTQYRAAERREQVLQSEYSRESGLVPNESSKAVRYRLLRAEVQTNRRLYEEMLVKVRDAAAASAMRSSNIQVIDSASVPGSPARPSMPLYGAAGLLSGLFLALALILTTTSERLSIQDPRQLASDLSLPVLGAIPAAAAEAAILKRIGAPAAANGKGTPPELVAWKRHGSLMTESFRNAFASVLLSDQASDAPRMIALTSAVPSEGKTTVAANLAVLYARSNRRVLLIDGDLRQPRLHEIFGVDNTRGLSTLLAALARHETFDVADWPIETEIHGLHLIPAGAESASVSHLLYSRSTQRLLRQLRNDFDTVLIDTPPVTVPDARGLATLADGVVLVVRAHATPSHIVTAAAQRLADDGARVLGTVLNHWNPKKSGSAYGPHGCGYGYYPTA